MKREELFDFFDHQLSGWTLARENYSSLERVRKKPFKVGGLEGYVQFNPARAVSTLAKLDAASIKKRNCFLCESNRFPEQKGLPILQDMELLVNPFPILPYHFTIVCSDHIPQQFNIDTAYALAEKLPGMVVFFNDSGAGASAPDHLHYQAVPKELMPLVKLIESSGDKSAHSAESSDPFLILRDPSQIYEKEAPYNIFVWNTADKGSFFAAVPRKCHRPDVFFKEPPMRRAVSPGALDMAGVIVTPYEEDFEAISESDIRDIYNQVAFKNE